jgi:nucleotidyltransferase/DNA polymerase involved in DNA repair
MGKRGPELYEKLRGRGSAELVTSWEQKSISEQTTFPHDIPADDSVKNRKMLERALSDLAEDVARRLVEGKFKSFKSVAITVRFGDFTTKTRTVTLPKPVSVMDSVDTLRVMQFQALRLFMPFLDRRENPDRKAIRLLGVRVEKLSEAVISQSLF